MQPFLLRCDTCVGASVVLLPFQRRSSTLRFVAAASPRNYSDENGGRVSERCAERQGSSSSGVGRQTTGSEAWGCALLFFSFSLGSFAMPISRYETGRWLAGDEYLGG